MSHGELDLIRILWESGIVVKIVLGILVLSSLVSWSIVFMKRSMIKTAQANDENLFKDFRVGGRFSEISERVESLPDSPAKASFLAFYDELKEIRQTFNGESEKENFRSFMQTQGLRNVERSLICGSNHANEKLEKSLATLASIGSISPFVGLFGTVWGIIDSFSALSSGGGTLEAVAPGIAEALVATAVGLAAAIPAVWFFNQFNNDITEINQRLESFRLEVLNKVERLYIKD